MLARVDSCEAYFVKLKTALLKLGSRWCLQSVNVSEKYVSTCSLFVKLVSQGQLRESAGVILLDRSIE